MSAVPEEVVPVIKLDIGCGKSKQPGFIGVDSIAFEGVDKVMDVRKVPWDYADNSVDEIHTSHFVEHLTREEWVPFFNEAYRVLKPKGILRVIVPHFSHACAHGDPTHKSFCSEWMAYYLNKGWRDINGPHTGYTCDFDWVIGGSWDDWLKTRNDESRMFAMNRYINSFRDLIITLTKRVKE
jgi:predicted SAM-dependent methyltransferase